MDLKKSYYNSEGIELNILQMVDQEPEWAANRIQEGEKSGIKAIKQQAEIDELVDMLESMTDDAEYYASYVSKYLFDKHGVKDRLKASRELIKKHKGE